MALAADGLPNYTHAIVDQRAQSDLVIRVPRPVRKLRAVKANNPSNDAAVSDTEPIPETETE